MNNTNLRPILHRFPVIADYWSNFCLPLFNTLARGEPLNTKNMKFRNKKLETSLCRRCEIYFDILNRFGVDHTSVADRQTDRQTDRTAFSNSAH